ncbi:Collagen alpha-1(XXVII) chain, partial [Ophiophagus hannah]
MGPWRSSSPAPCSSRKSYTTSDRWLSSLFLKTFQCWSIHNFWRQLVPLINCPHARRTRGGSKSEGRLRTPTIRPAEAGGGFRERPTERGEGLPECHHCPPAQIKPEAPQLKKPNDSRRPSQMPGGRGLFLSAPVATHPDASMLLPPPRLALGRCPTPQLVGGHPKRPRSSTPDVHAGEPPLWDVTPRGCPALPCQGSPKSPRLPPSFVCPCDPAKMLIIISGQLRWLGGEIRLKGRDYLRAREGPTLPLGKDHVSPLLPPSSCPTRDQKHPRMKRSPLAWQLIERGVRSAGEINQSCPFGFAISLFLYSPPASFGYDGTLLARKNVERSLLFSEHETPGFACWPIDGCFHQDMMADLWWPSKVPAFGASGKPRSLKQPGYRVGFLKLGHLKMGGLQLPAFHSQQNSGS